MAKALDEARDTLDTADDAVEAMTLGTGKSLPPPWNLLVMILHVLRLLLDFIDKKQAAIVPPPPQSASQAATSTTTDPIVKAEQAQAQAIDAASRGKVARAAPDDTENG